MTREEAIKMAKADLKCMERDTSGQDEMCNSHKCDECSLNYERGNMGEQKEWLRLAIKALEQEPKWIPVTERLPEEEGFYLVTRRITDDVATFIFRRTPTSKDYWKRCVTAWMPLPKPYEGGQEDGKS